MGQRANLWLRTGEGDSLFYTHHRANALDAELFWGPDAAMRFARALPRAEGWLDEVWAEGGAVIDAVERVLLWFGGEDVLLDVPLRRVCLGVMRELWPGWEIRWAHDHVLDLVRYVGGDVSGLLREDEPTGEVVLSVQRPEWADTALSMRCADGTWKLHALAASPELLFAGPALAEALARAPLPDTLAWRTETFPFGGAHVDEAARRVDAWAARPVADGERRLRDAWPGWDARWHRDRFEAVAERVGRRLTLPHASEADHVALLRGLVGADGEAGARFDEALARWRSRR